MVISDGRSSRQGIGIMISPDWFVFIVIASAAVADAILLLTGNY